MKGIYLLLIHLKKDTNIKIGALGRINFKKGYYIYVGSAQNSLESRIQRHLSKNKKKFWHIDYLLLNKNAKITDVFYKEADKIEECKSANQLLKIFTPIEKFGSSDCKCRSHLFFKNLNSLVK